MGIYAVMAFSVSQRSQEIAIRMTLGAQQVDIAKLGFFPAQGWCCSDVASVSWALWPCRG
jgi:ABC-type lipoprotein release transport system permease subunit